MPARHTKRPALLSCALVAAALAVFCVTPAPVWADDPEPPAAAAPALPEEDVQLQAADEAPAAEPAPKPSEPDQEPTPAPAEELTPAPEDAPQVEPAPTPQPEATPTPQEAPRVPDLSLPGREVVAADVADPSETLHQSADQLFAHYAEQRMLQALPHADEGQLAPFAASLSGANQRAYEVLRLMVSEVAAGERTSTTFTVPLTSLFDKTTFTPAELGVKAIVTDGVFNDAALDAASKKVDIDLSGVIKKLLNEHPYELYWYDKTASTQMGGLSFSWNSRANVLKVTGSLTFKFPVCKGYAAGSYKVSTTNASRVDKAIATARKVVADNEGKTTYQRMLAYKNKICDLVSYDNAAAKGGVAFGDPWQLISVLDGDKNTNVVCEGYSKAFKYLCDLSDFDNATCLLVTGTMSGGTGAGAHMWNVVAMDDGKNYLVDVTNCDTGTVGAPTKLFMAACTKGSVSGGYSFAASKTMTYKYDSDTRAYYSSKELTIATKAYNPSASTVSAGTSTEPPSYALEDASVTVGSVAYTGTAQTPALTVKMGSTTLTEGKDYHVTSKEYRNNTNVGTGTVEVSIVGAGSYTGSLTKSVSFSITKKAQSISASGAKGDKLSVAMGKTAKLGATRTGDGKLSYSSANTGVATVSAAGVVTPKKVGTVKLTITAAETGTYKKATKTVTVTVTQGSQTITASNKNAVMGKTVSLGAKTSGDGKLTYKSSNTGIATVSAKGVVTGKKVGTAKITVTAAKTGNYQQASKTITITVKRANPVTASAKKGTVTVSASKVKGAAQTLASNVSVSKAQGSVSYANSSNDATAKKFTVNGSTGKVTVPKGTKAGTYTIIVKVTAKGNGTYFSGSKNVTYKIQVK